MRSGAQTPAAPEERGFTGAPASLPASTRPTAAPQRGASVDPLWRTAPYLRRELLQIGTLSLLILAILAVLTFVLR